MYAGDDYVTWEGYKDEATGETKIGLSYAHLCRDVKAGGRIKIGDGQVRREPVDCSPTGPWLGCRPRLNHRQDCKPLWLPCRPAGQPLCLRAALSRAGLGQEGPTPPTQAQHDGPGC